MKLTKLDIYMRDYDKLLDSEINDLNNISQDSDSLSKERQIMDRKINKYNNYLNRKRYKID